MISDLALLGRQVAADNKAARREPALVFFGLAFPILLLVIFATLNKDAHVDRLGGLLYTQYYVPEIVALSVMNACFANLSIVLCFRREAGELKRVRATPLPPRIFMESQIITALVASTGLVAVTMGAGRIFYDVSFPGRYAALLLTLLCGAVAFCSLGIAVAGLVPSAEVSPAVANIILFPLSFISGTFTVVPQGSVLAKIAAVFPVRHFNEAVFAAFDPRRSGAQIAWDHLAVLVAWGAFGLVIALRYFRWEPQRG